MTEQVCSTDNPEALRGPWVAVLADRSGYVLDDRDIIEADRIAVVRDTAAPYRPEMDEPRLPSTYRRIDVLYLLEEIQDEPDDVPARWAQAKSVAAALNANPVALPADTIPFGPGKPFTVDTFIADDDPQGEGTVAAVHAARGTHGINIGRYSWRLDEAERLAQAMLASVRAGRASLAEFEAMVAP